MVGGGVDNSDVAPAAGRIFFLNFISKILQRKKCLPSFARFTSSDIVSVRRFGKGYATTWGGDSPKSEFFDDVLSGQPYITSHDISVDFHASKRISALTQYHIQSSHE